MRSQLFLFWENHEEHLFSGWNTASNFSVLWSTNMSCFSVIAVSKSCEFNQLFNGCPDSLWPLKTFAMLKLIFQTTGFSVF